MGRDVRTFLKKGLFVEKDTTTSKNFYEWNGENIVCAKTETQFGVDCLCGTLYGGEYRLSEDRGLSEGGATAFRFLTPHFSFLIPHFSFLISHFSFLILHLFLQHYD